MGRKPNGPGLGERSNTNGYTWTTYPERLEAAGITWKLYQGGTGEPGTPTDNYTDNSLEFFSAYQVKEGADPNGPLVQKGVTNHTLKDLRDDAVAGRLAQVTWIVAPYKYCEHPEASPSDGAHFINKVLEALTGKPGGLEPNSSVYQLRRERRTVRPRRSPYAASLQRNAGWRHGFQRSRIEPQR